MPEQPFEEEIDLVDYFQVLLKWKWLIIAGTMLGAIIGIVQTPSPAPIQYEAETLLLLSPYFKTISTDGSDGKSRLAIQTYTALTQSDELTHALADTLRQLLNAKTISSSAYQSYNLDSELLGSTADSQSPLLALRVTTSSKDAAIYIANLWAGIFLARHQGLSSGAAKGYYNWVTSQYETAAKNLEKAEESLQNMQANHHEHKTRALISNGKQI